MQINAAENGVDDHIEDALRFFDEAFARRGIEVWQRPLETAIGFLVHVVLAVKDNGTQETIDRDNVSEYMGRPWFKKLHQMIEQWYRKRYGAALDVRKTRTFRSIALLHRTPFELSIPMTLERPGKPGESVWIVFPVDLQPEERAFDFLTKPPNIDAMTDAARSRNERVIAWIAHGVRQINSNLRTANRTHPEMGELIRSIERHLERAVNDLLNDGPNGVGSALYELYMAVEKALKSVLVQKHRSVKPSHILPALLRRVIKANPTLSLRLPRGMPTWREVNIYRYGAPPGTSLNEAIRLYYRVIAFLQPITKALKRKVVAKNAAFEIGRVPWMEYPST